MDEVPLKMADVHWFSTSMLVCPRVTIFDTSCFVRLRIPYHRIDKERADFSEKCKKVQQQLATQKRQLASLGRRNRWRDTSTTVSKNLGFTQYINLAWLGMVNNIKQYQHPTHKNVMMNCLFVLFLTTFWLVVYSITGMVQMRLWPGALLAMCRSSTSSTTSLSLLS